MKILLTEDQLRSGVRRMANEIAQSYQRGPMTVIAIMTGSLVLLADLIRCLDNPLRVGLIQASSYRGGMEPGDLTINVQMMLDIRDRDVLLVDDIFDTGRTLEQVFRIMEKMQPASLRSAVLLHKQGRQQVRMQPDFVAFTIPDEFVVGYGLDYHDLYRNLPYLAVLDETEIETHNRT